jgi:octopine/nopaline transport system substrate-binding protein
MKRAAISCLVLFFAIAVCSIARAEEKKWTKVVIATEGGYAPYNLTRPDGSLDGFEVDLAHVLCAEMKVECTIVAQSFDGMIPALNAGKFDAIMAALSATKKRAETIDFSTSYGDTGQTFATLKDGPLVDLPGKGQVFSLDSNASGAEAAIEALKPFLKGKTVGVQGAATVARFADEYFKDVADIREYQTTEQHDLDLVAGRVDLLMASTGYLKTMAKKPGNEDVVLTGPRFFGGLFGKGSSVGLRKSDPELKAMFNEAIAAAKADGTVKRLSEKWFGFDLTPQ